MGGNVGGASYCAGGVTFNSGNGSTGATGAVAV